MPQTRGAGPRTKRFGVVATAAALIAATAPAVAHAQDTTDPGASGSTDTSSLEDVIGEIPQITIGDAGFGAGSEGLQDAGSGAIPEAALSAGQVLGSVAPLEALGSAGGSAAASVASSGSLPGSVYANPTGSIGSGTIGLGSIAIPEYVFPVLSVQFMGGFFTALGERQQAAELYPHELTFWHDVVTGSAEGGTLVQAAAEDAGIGLPGALAGSIDSVQQAALEDPFEEQEKLKAELEAEAAAEGDDPVDPDYADDSDDSDGAGAADVTVAAADAGVGTDDDEASTGRDDAAAYAADPAAPSEAEADAGADAADATGAAATDAGYAGAQTLDAAAAPAPVAAGAVAPTAAEPRLAETGVDTVMIAGAAVMSLLLGGLLLVASRRRA